MATLKLAVVPTKVLKNGQHKIRIAICHQSETRYITTRFKISSLNQFKDGQIINYPDEHIINIKLRNLLNEYEDKLDKIQNLSLYSCAQLRRKLIYDNSISPTATFYQVASKYISELIQDKRNGYAGLIERNTRYFMAFCSGDILLSSITAQIITNYSRWLHLTKHLNDTSIGMCMSRTRVIINRAKRDQLVKYDIDPFEYYHMPSSPERELDISVEDFKKIRDAELDQKKFVVSRDAFILSYYLGGVNLIDLLSYDFRHATRFEYIRTKSRNMKQGDKRISITIPPEALPIIKRYMNRNTGRIDFGYKFSYANLSRYITRTLKKLAIKLGIESKVVYYSARKSFVQHGFELGIPLEILEYCIGQSMKRNRPIFSYVKIMRTHADKAIRKILDNLQ
jgi:site-specific recombinase XerD